MQKVNIFGFLLLAANVALWCMLGFSSTTTAAPRQPFGNAVEQRQKIVNELREIKELLKAHKDLLKTQNSLLRGQEKDRVPDRR